MQKLREGHGRGIGFYVDQANGEGIMAFTSG